MLTDWNGTEVKIGSRVRHAYEPWPGKGEGIPPGRGYHAHFFCGTGTVIAVHSTSATIKTGDGRIRATLGALIEVLEGDTPPGKYIIPLSGPYREPPHPSDKAA